ncbi:recombinase family protein [Blastopirellula marina]|uniref:Site-specific recombinases n=1 Tax=Blastopirellula marina DSM 3645 TaxID=314230 RepID=A3ZQE1_9BACT|nr:recombinase family protein [Blastopirellula marina]EAQ81417.1 site-specific recombinases [Blastopirellula marina DSM 3645]
MRLRMPIVAPKGRLLQVAEYARYSTDEQNPRSITDQYAYSEKILRENNAPEFETTQLSDAEMSGELVSRPGIDRLRQGIAKRAWDLIIAEDSSRLYRHETECMVLVEEAVDEGIRVICINDFVDTAEPDWRDRLHDAARHHAKANKFTAYRIKRSHDALWEMGAGIGKLRPGYSRRASYPATSREPESGPFFDSIDTVEAALVKSAYEMIAAGDHPTLVAGWLTKKGLRKCVGAKNIAYSKTNVNELIRRSIYRGHDVYRHKVSEKKLRTGKSKQRHRPDQVLTREMPNLRIVSDALWYAANRKIDERRRNNGVPSGDEHPLAGIPRTTRFPLSTLFVCGICGGKMWSDGRNEGGYRCSNSGSGACWNKATALRGLTHRQISEVVVRELLSLNSTMEVLVEHIGTVLKKDTDHESICHKLKKQMEQLRNECDNLGEALAKSGPNGQFQTLLNLLATKEQKWEEIRAELACLEEHVIVPASISPMIIRKEIERMSGDLLELWNCPRKVDSGSVLTGR